MHTKSALIRSLLLPSLLIIAILLLSRWAYCYTRDTAAALTAMLDAVEQAVEDADWSEADRRLRLAHSEWGKMGNVYHVLTDHDQLDAAESLFIGALSSCRQQDKNTLLVFLELLKEQLALLRETQSLCIQNIL